MGTLVSWPMYRVRIEEFARSVTFEWKSFGGNIILDLEKRYLIIDEHISVQR